MGWVHFSACTKRCVPPHPLRSAQHLPPSGGRLLLSCISSCLTNLTNDRTQPRLIPASNHAPWQRTAQLDAGLAKPDRRGKAGSERRKACFHPGGSGFHLPRNVRSAFQFYSSSFYGHKAGSLFLSLYAPRFCLAASAGFGRQFTKLRALSRLRRRYDSRKKRILLSPVSFPIPPPCGQDWLPWCECSAGTPPDRPPSCRPQSAA